MREVHKLFEDADKSRKVCYEENHVYLFNVLYINLYFLIMLIIQL